MDEAVTVALANNPEIATGRASLDTLRAQVIVAGAFPNPEVSADGAPSLPDATDYDFRVGIDQQIPIAGKIGKRSALARTELQREQQLVTDLERRISQRVRTTYRTAQLVDQRVALASELAALNERLLDTALARFRRGEVSELDVRQFEIELAQRRQEAERLGAERATALIELSRLMNVPYDPAVELAASIAGISAPIAIEPLLEAARKRPDLQALDAEVEAAERERSLRSAERWADPVVGAFYRRERGQFDEPQELTDVDDFVGVEVRIPLPIFYRHQGEIAAAEARKVVAAKRRAALELEIDRAIRDSHQRATVQLRALADLARGIEAAAAAERLAERAYRQGLINAVQQIQSQQQRFTLLDARLDALDAYYAALSELEGAVNAPLESMLAPAKGGQR